MSKLHPAVQMAADNWPLVAVNDDGIRPAGKPDECFYCNQKVGQPHGHTCVVVTKRVKVQYTFELEIDVPYSWAEKDVMFHRSESSWCADNGVQDLLDHMERNEDGGACLCDGFVCEYIGVADDTPRRALSDVEE